MTTPGRIISVERLPGSGTLPENYWIVGYLTKPPVIGESWRVLRTIREGFVCNGIFTTSPVQAIVESSEGYLIETENSRYKVRFL